MWKKMSALFLAIVFVAGTTQAVFAYGFPGLKNQQSALRSSFGFNMADDQQALNNGKNFKDIAKEQGLSKEEMMQKRTNHAHAFRFSWVRNEALANLFGMTSDALQKALASGQSLAQLANEKNIPLDRVRELLLDQMKEKLSGLVQDGRITAAQMEEKLAQFEANLPNILEKTCDRSSRHMSKQSSKDASPTDTTKGNTIFPKQQQIL